MFQKTQAAFVTRQAVLTCSVITLPDSADETHGGRHLIMGRLQENLPLEQQELETHFGNIFHGRL